MFSLSLENPTRVVLESGFHAVDSRFQVLDYRSPEWIPEVAGFNILPNGIPHSQGSNKDSGFQIFLNGIPYPWDNTHDFGF